MSTSSFLKDFRQWRWKGLSFCPAPFSHFFISPFASVSGLVGGVTPFLSFILFAPAARLFPGKNTRLLFLHVQIIFYGFDPFDATRDFPRFIDGLLRINETAQFHDALVGFDTDLE